MRDGGNQEHEADEERRKQKELKMKGLGPGRVTEADAEKQQNQTGPAPPPILAWKQDLKLAFLQCQSRVHARSRARGKVSSDH